MHFNDQNVFLYLRGGIQQNADSSMSSTEEQISEVSSKNRSFFSKNSFVWRTSWCVNWKSGDF